MQQIIGLSAIFFSVLYFVDRTPEVDQQYQLINSARLESFEKHPPADALDWTKATLPDSQDALDSTYASIWHRFRFDREHFPSSEEQTDDRWAVYVVAGYSNAAIYLNGSFLGNGGNIEPPIPIYRWPLKFAFHESLLKNKGNELYYHYIKGTPDAFIEPLYIGPVSEFNDWYQNTMFMKSYLRIGILIMMGVIFSIMLLMFILRPQDRYFGWYAASILVWMLHYAMRMLPEFPIANHHIISAYSYLTLFLFVSFSTQYISSFMNIRYAIMDKIILVWSIVGGILLFIIAAIWGPAVNLYGQYLWMPTALLMGGYCLFIICIGFNRRPTIENRLHLVSIGLLLLTGIRDYLFDFSDLVPGSTFYLQFGAGFVMVFWAIILMRRFAKALDLAETLNNELEERVSKKSLKLEKYYQEATKIESERALVAERERIMRDMHDGLGGQLVQILSLAEHHQELSPVRNTLRQALRDLRLIIDSLSVSEGDLVTVLGTFRYRTEKMIKEVGLKYHWQVDDLPALKQLGPESALQILRILQEAVSNIMQHAEATTITFISQYQEQSAEQNAFVIIEVKDNGKGYNIDKVKSSGK
ncbi:MAG: signal transduction histidine kinase, partial [Enterobacterales bacterium]